MSKSGIALYEEDTLSFEVPDAALELAGSKCWGSTCEFSHDFILLGGG